MATNSVRGVVTETLPNLLYRVDVEGREYICYLAGKFKLAKLRLYIGDKVMVVLDPYKGNNTNRIVERVR